MSPKLPLAAQEGFALRADRQAPYVMQWHMHDCMMLLWPRSGALRSAWLDDHAGTAADVKAPAIPPRHITLARGHALLLPAATPHCTRSATQRQQHGELYLVPEFLRHCPARGLLRLDAASVAMLDALLAPALSARGAALLVPAVVAQLATSRPLACPQPELPLSRRMAAMFQHAIDDGQAPPTIDYVADVLGISTRQLQRCCQQEFGMTPVSLRRALFVREIHRLLETGEPRSKISARFGFAHSGHLNRMLRGLDGQGALDILR
jgi:AraC-like DNA-binding protein